MSTACMDAGPCLGELRQEAHYWRAQHARAVEREAAWKQKAQELERIVCEQSVHIAELTRQREANQARVAWLEQQVFGRKSEQTQDVEPPTSPDETRPSEVVPVRVEVRRVRGKQPGAPGYGRKPRDRLPTQEVLHDLPPDQRRCPRCGKPFAVFPGTEDSEVIDWEIRVVRRVHRRVRYRPQCGCQAVPGIVTAPAPPKVIPKSLFADGFWVQILLEKFLFQRPLYRVRKVLALAGLSVSQGTLTGGLRRIGELLQPIYTAILERSRSATHWKMDETRWMVFVQVEGKDSYRWWLWVVITHDTVVYLLDPSRSAEVPRHHLGEEAQGIINADRYSAYQALGVRLLIAFCWSHVRRDFVRIQEGYKTLAAWAESWVTRINELFALNDRRLSVRSDPAAFPAADLAVRQAIEQMADRRDQQLADPGLHAAPRKALESLCRHWAGCILFLDHPEIPMDNNESERQLRDPAVGRKNYYGSGSVWSGLLTAMLFTLFQTLLKNHLDPQKWLLAYFEACAQAGGQVPPDPDRFLPWNLSDEQKSAWTLPEPFT